MRARRAKDGKKRTVCTVRFYLLAERKGLEPSASGVTGREQLVQPSPIWGNGCPYPSILIGGFPMKIHDAFLLYHDYVLCATSSRSRQTETGRWQHHIAPELAAYELEQINALTIAKFRATLLEKKLAPQTVCHCLSLLRRILNRAVEWGLYSGPVPKIRMPKFDNRRIRYLTHSEAANLVSTLYTISPIWADVAVFDLNTGLRRGELLSLLPSQIDLTNRECHILESKTFHARSIPLNDTAMNIAQKHLAVSESALPLFHAKGNPLNPYSRHFREAVRQCGFNAGVSDRRSQVCFHTLRHTFASWLVQGGVPLQVVSQLLGHASLKMTLRYAHLAPSQHRAAVDSLCISVLP